MWTPNEPWKNMVDDEAEAERLRERQKEEELRNTPLVWTPGEKTTQEDTTRNFMVKKAYKPVKPGLSQTLPRVKSKRSVCIM